MVLDMNIELAGIDEEFLENFAELIVNTVQITIFEELQ